MTTHAHKGVLLLLVCLCAQASAQQWQQRTASGGPTARRLAELVYDSGRDRVVMFGMQRNVPNAETWEWDGTTWSLRTLSVQPPARESHAIAYDAARRRVVIFGGYLNGEGGLRLADTWEYDGNTWVARTPVNSPSGRALVQMTYDSRRQVCVLFGGGGPSASGVLNDTWEWDGTDWRRRTTTSAPSPRQNCPLVYDSWRGITRLYGGQAVGGFTVSDTWEYDGNDWVQRMPATTPGPRNGHGMAFDALTGRTVLTQGYDGSGPRNETWEFDGLTWKAISTATRPPGRSWAGFCYDAARAGFVLFGGWTNAGAFSDTWIYNSAIAPAQTTAFPSGWIASEGNSHSSAPFAFVQSRMQSLLMASRFTGATTGTIQRLEMRCNQDTKVFPQRTLDLDISLGFAAKTPQRAHPIFDQNVVQNSRKLVRTGPINLPLQQPTPVGPAPFALAIPLSTPFAWANQDLVLELAASNNSQTGAFEIDAVDEPVTGGVATPLGTGCPGSQGVPIYTNRETKQLVAGGAAIGTLTNACPNAITLFLLGTDYTPMPIGPCVAATNPVVGLPAFTDYRGESFLVIDVPHDARLVGGSFVAQWVVSDAQSPIGLTFSNGTQLKLGPADTAGFDTLLALTKNASSGTKLPTSYLGPVLRFGL